MSYSIKEVRSAIFKAGTNYGHSYGFVLTVDVARALNTSTCRARYYLSKYCDDGLIERFGSGHGQYSWRAAGVNHE